MLPLPTSNARAVFVSAVLTLAVGIAAETAVVVIFATTSLLALTAALAFTLPLAARLRAERLELAWWHAHAEPLASRGAVLTGVPFEVQVSLRHHGKRSRALCELVPALPSFVRCTRGLHADVVLEARSRSDFRFTLVSDASGRIVLQGLSVMVRGPFDLFRAPLYFPNPLVIKALPRAFAHTTPPLRNSAGSAIEHAGRTQRRQRGGNSDLRELREYLPGDPFKAIAWKASAKTGKLMIRELEAEVQDSLYVVLDVSGSMRGGVPGQRKLDHGIEVATEVARAALDRGDQVGVITVDGRIVSHARLGAGVSHANAVHEVLLAATEVVDQDLTDVDDDELYATVARYIRQQDGVDYARGKSYDVDALLRHATAALSGEREQGDVVASDRRTKILRRYCRARGIFLRYRPETRALAKTAGLAKALRLAAGASRVPRSLLVITDFDGVLAPEPLLKVLRLLRAQQHAVSFLFPDGRALAPEPTSTRDADLQLVYGLAEERRLREARVTLGKLGIPLSVTPLRRARAASVRPVDPSRERVA